jgi:hypothetical protein
MKFLGKTIMNAKIKPEKTGTRKLQITPSNWRDERIDLFIQRKVAVRRPLLVFASASRAAGL